MCSPLCFVIVLQKSKAKNDADRRGHCVMGSPTDAANETAEAQE